MTICPKCQGFVGFVNDSEGRKPCLCDFLTAPTVIPSTPSPVQGETPMVLGHPATIEWCLAVDEHHAATERELAEAKERLEACAGLAAAGAETESRLATVTAELERTKETARMMAKVADNHKAGEAAAQSSLALAQARAGELEAKLIECEAAVGAEKAALEAEKNDQLQRVVIHCRTAWEAGFRLCRSCGDNHSHFDGEQKERQWQKYLTGVDPEMKTRAVVSPARELMFSTQPTTGQVSVRYREPDGSWPCVGTPISSPAQPAPVYSEEWMKRAARAICEEFFLATPPHVPTPKYRDDIIAILKRHQPAREVGEGWAYREARRLLEHVAQNLTKDAYYQEAHQIKSFLASTARPPVSPAAAMEERK